MKTEKDRPRGKSQINGLPRRFLRHLLLVAMAGSERSHGYELAEAVRRFGLTVDMAGIYRELRAMEQHDLLASDWEASESGPDRRVYELTTDGEAAMLEAAAELELARDLLSAVIALVPRMSEST